MVFYSFVLLFVFICVSFTIPVFFENANNSLCHKKLLESQKSSLIGRFVPQCTEEGHFAPRQCFASICFCVDRVGRRLKNFKNVRIVHSQNQTCQCAQDFEEYHKLGMSSSTNMFSCDSFGNYNKVQCYGRECFCVDLFGKILSEKPPVHISKRHRIKC